MRIDAFPRPLSAWVIKTMATPLAQLLYTEEEYLKMERASEERHEYIDGYVQAMAGESPEHGDISVNLTGILHSQLRGKSCRVRIANSKVRSGPRPVLSRKRKGLYSYPDVFVICGEMKFHDQYKDVITNPTVIFEVLSESTETFDRGEKFLRYQNYNPSLQDYVLVSQTSPTIEHYSRQPDGSWAYRLHQGLSANFSIASIKCKLKLAEVYERVSFTPTKPDQKLSVKKAASKKATAKLKGRKNR